ncbi:PREDICTED: putative nuclease HARBI1 [Cyphomyrmex costatus]|uniref:putative nuclease HARBI1 n=1 Tax=Cyphomyrmex costatus TaxID=456900 RepID=UPI0008521DD2|nr:PREDICTED: putative nuclease HARBI1 [Cyphomyrmex costatus]
MISLMNRLENNSVNMKIVRDESGKMIQSAEGILCEYVDSDGNTTLKFVQTTDSCCSESLSEIESENIMPCSTIVNTTQENNFKNVQKFIIAHDFLFSSSDSSDEELQYLLVQKRKIPRMKHFIRDVIDQYTAEESQRHFRLSRKICKRIINLFKQSKYCPKGLRGRNNKTPKEHVLVFLWFAANKTVLRSVADRFDMQIATVHQIIKRVTNFLIDLAPSIIRFPVTEQERQEKAQEFRNICEIDGIVGCIDGMYISIRTPVKKIRHTYVNRHDETALTLQGICDAKKGFIDCFTGVSSKCHDARVYDMSFIKEKVSGMGDYYHIIGDAAYPISTNLLTPYSGNQLTPVQANFNYHFCTARVKIENAFGLLKCRFRQLTRLDMWSVTLMSKFIISCCVLHNLCIEENDILDFCEYEELPFPIQQCTYSNNRIRMLGQMKRDRIAFDLI